MVRYFVVYCFFYFFFYLPLFILVNFTAFTLLQEVGLEIYILVWTCVYYFWDKKKPEHIPEKKLKEEEF